jgi:hypothetical protein
VIRITLRILQLEKGEIVMFKYETPVRSLVSSVRKKKPTRARSLACLTGRVHDTFANVPPKSSIFLQFLVLVSWPSNLRIGVLNGLNQIVTRDRIRLVFVSWYLSLRIGVLNSFNHDQDQIR